MSLLPWQSFQLRTDLDRDEVLRLLKRSIPARHGLPDLFAIVPFFYGTVDVATGSFRLQRNSFGKAQGLLPQLRGRVRPGKRGSVVEASISPSVGFWIYFFLVMSAIGPFVACIPLGLLLWLFNVPMQGGSHPLVFVVVGLLAVMMSAVLWGPLLLMTYLPMRRYRDELTNLLERMAERTPDGLSILEAAPTPEQVKARLKAAQQAAKLFGAFLTLFGFAIFTVGIQGIITGQLTLHSRNRMQQQPHLQYQTQTLAGAQAVTFSSALIALGSGLAVAGGLCWRMSYRDPSQRSWPPLETALLSISVALLVLSVVLGLMAFS